MAKGLVECGDICYIHNGTSGGQNFSIPHYETKEGIGTVVNYPARGAWFLSSYRNYSLLIQDLRKWYCADRKNWVIVEAPYLPFYYLYIRAARKAGYKVGVIAHEWLGTFQNSKKLVRWLNHRYADVFGYSVDAILPISEYIIEKIQKFKKPYLKVPVEADYSMTISQADKDAFFLYCVSAEYLRVIKMVLNGFKAFVNVNSDYRMVLILAGGKSAIRAVCDTIGTMGLADVVIIKHKIPFDELLCLNKSASGLVVPLDPYFEQDKARFSQKIAEYLSSGTVIISNNVGEVKHYFTDKENIILCDYSSDGFCGAFQWIADNPSLSEKIGVNGFELGKRNFDYRLCGRQLHDFLLEI